MKYLLAIGLIILTFSNAHTISSKWLGKDKIMHFSESAMLTYWNYGVSKDYMHNSNSNSKLFAVSVTFSLGFGKECSDKYLKKTFFSKYDIFYDALGIAVGLILINNLR